MSGSDWDELDARLVGLLRSTPNLPVVEMARRLDVARGTVQARLDRLIRDGVIVGFGPDIDRSAAGFGMLQRILELPGITRRQTHLALNTSIDRTVADLVARGR